MHAFLLAATLAAAWVPQPSGSTSELRGLSVLDAKHAWASGSGGTVLRTKDGEHWEKLTVPGGEALDFRDVEALDEQTVVLMSAGPGDASRIYRSTDAGSDLEARPHQPRQGRLLRRDRVLGRAERRRRRRPGQPPLRRAHHARRRPDLGEARGPRPAADVHGRGRLRGERHVPDRRQGLAVTRGSSPAARGSRASSARTIAARPGTPSTNADPGRQRVVGSLLRRVPGREARLRRRRATTSSRNSPA